MNNDVITRVRPILYRLYQSLIVGSLLVTIFFVRLAYDNYSAPQIERSRAMQALTTASYETLLEHPTPANPTQGSERQFYIRHYTECIEQINNGHFDLSEICMEVVSKAGVVHPYLMEERPSEVVVPLLIALLPFWIFLAKQWLAWIVVGKPRSEAA